MRFATAGQDLDFDPGTIIVEGKELGGLDVTREPLAQPARAVMHGHGG